MLFAVNVIFGAEKLGDQGGIISIHKMLVTNLRGPLGVKLNKSNIELIFTYYIIYFYLFLLIILSIFTYYIIYFYLFFLIFTYYIIYFYLFLLIFSYFYLLLSLNLRILLMRKNQMLFRYFDIIDSCLS